MKKILVIIALLLSTQIYSQSTQVDKLPEPMEYGQKIFYDKEGHLIVETKKNLSQEEIETVKQYVKTYYKIKDDMVNPEIVKRVLEEEIDGITIKRIGVGGKMLDIRW